MNRITTEIGTGIGIEIGREAGTEALDMKGGPQTGAPQIGARIIGLVEINMRTSSPTRIMMVTAVIAVSQTGAGVR